MKNKKKLPLGQSDFKNLIDKGFYYVDKTLFVKEIIDASAESILVPRPRRFGKTLNLSTLKYFYEKTHQDRSYLFTPFNIWKQGQYYTDKQGKYPVIFLTFKDVKQLNWEASFAKIKHVINLMYEDHNYLLNSETLSAYQKKYIQTILNEEGTLAQYENSLSNLIAYLSRVHSSSVVVLVDEYDTPIHSGYFEGYYKEIIGFMRGFLGGGLKDNSNIEKAVITGILRVAKESIFSGLNNPGIYSLIKPEYSDSFGFTGEELENMLAYYEISNRSNDIDRWYNGYIFGGRIVFNPWSIINFVDSQDKLFRPYWSNTGSNELIEQFLTTGSDELKKEIEVLIEKGVVTKPIIEDITFPDLPQREDLVWSFLLFTGYLKAENGKQVGKNLVYDLKIPNLEVEHVYEEVIRNWLNKGSRGNLDRLLRALVRGDITTFERLFQEFVISVMSYYDIGKDEPERVYQAFVLGMLVGLGSDYQVKSNRESGFGRYDVMIIPRDASKIGIVMEFKKIDSFYNETKDTALKNALNQIKDKMYSRELRDRDITRIIELAVVFDGKRVWVKVNRQE